MVKTKSQKVLGAKSYVCRSCRGKTGRGAFLPPPPPILNLRLSFEKFTTISSCRHLKVKMVVRLKWLRQILVFMKIKYINRGLVFIYQAEICTDIV